MREKVIEFIVANTSYSYDELKTWSDKVNKNYQR